MITDNLLAFVPYGSPLSLVGAANATFASNVLDLAGVGVGIAPRGIWGNATLFGGDVGVGSNKPELNVVIGTSLTSGGATTLDVSFQAAVDTGVGGGYLPGTWTEIVSQGGIALTTAVSGAVVMRVPFLPVGLASMRPRFLRLLFSPTTAGATPSGSFTAGTIASALVTMVRDDLSNKYVPANYSVA